MPDTVLSPRTESPLTQVFAPRSIAVVGASPNPRRIGSRVLSNVRRHGFAGDIYVVNPNHEEVDSLRAYPSLQSLPAVPDLVLLAVDADASLEILAELGKVGGHNAVLLASGFEESGSGARRARRLTELARTYGLNVVGPNSQGLWNVPHRMVLAFGSEAQRARVDAGPVAVLAESGSLGGAVTRRIQDLGVGVAYFVSTGDGTVIDTADYLRHVIADPAVRVVALYLEGIRDGRRLAAALEEADRRGVRVVALPGGVSTVGRATATSHTGRIIARPQLFTDVLEQHGVVVAATVRELVAATRTLALAPDGLKRAPQTAVLGISGGMLALLVDACERRIELAEFSDDTLSRLRGTLPPYTDSANPVDVTGAVVEDEALLLDTVDAVLADPGVEALIVGLDNLGYDRLVRNVERFTSVASRTRKPLVFSLWDPPSERAVEVERRLGEEGVFVADDPSDAASPLEWLIERKVCRAPSDLPERRAFETADYLSTWPGIQQLARTLGARIPPTQLLGGEVTLLDDQLGPPPYVVKPLPNAVHHKTDRGLVHLHLYTFDDVAEAVTEVRSAVGLSVPVVIQQMVTGVELLVTVSHDPDWGYVLTVGSGGKLVELLDDFTHLVVPCHESDVRDVLARLKVHRVLRGHRDTPPSDIDALVATIVQLQQVVLTHRDTVDEIELNPLVVGAAGQGVFLIDVLATVKGRTP
ncbi:MAG: hypothetical protein GEV09_11105 [Pseudonocardiaceae bacterium]|nr:hypothetical protein [Pseudonocardiaceae bacterium]